MLANVIWLYYWPFALFRRAFPFVALLVVLLEAGALLAARVSWRRSIVSSVIANAASYFGGMFLVFRFRSLGLLPHIPVETFIGESHLWRGFIVAYALSVLIEAGVYRPIMRSVRLPRLLLLAAVANLASYALVITVNWRACHDVLKQMTILEDLTLRPAEPPSSEPSGGAEPQ